VKVELSVFQNPDDSLLVWNVEEAIPDCVGFAIRREMERDGKTQANWLDNFVGFAGEDHEKGERRPSTEWPFQGFSWTDHEFNAGDTARYQVVPVVLDGDGSLKRSDSRASDWATGREPSTRYRAFFNRGYVMSQFMAHYLEETGKTLPEFKTTIRDEDDRTIRQFLSGDLRVEMLKLLKEALTGGGEVHAALFELSDDELIEALAALGPRAHVVLANGSIEQHKEEALATARERDGNEAGRERLEAAKVDVEKKNRFISPGPLGHNKFVVFSDSAGKAKTVWTGSTNWSATGLCTQLNNGLLIEDEDIAKVYREQWDALRKAKSEFPDSLVDGNSQPKSPRPEATVWFTRTHGEVDLDALNGIIEGANESVVFLMFQPGEKGVLKSVRNVQKDKPDVVVHGVVSELPDPNDESTVKVVFHERGKEEEHTLDVIEPEGRPNPIAWWAAEATHADVRANIGYAIVHSKVFVVDPLSTRPAVVTGSHNFSVNASTKNDENFIVVQGDRALAEAYLVNIFGAWRHYRARVASGPPFKGLSREATWMAKSLEGRQGEGALWGF
jgi:hypothetical protein